MIPYKVLPTVRHQSRGFVPYCTHLPYDAVLAIGLSSINDGVFIIAGTLLPRHTQLIVIHVGSFGTSTTIHRTEADLASVVSLTEGVAGAPTGGHVVAVHGVCWAFNEGAWWETQWGCCHLI